MLDSSKTYPALADGLLALGAGQCWNTPQEKESAQRGDFPHGTVDDCDWFQRIRNDQAAVWLNTYAAMATLETLKVAGWPDGPELEAALAIESHELSREIGLGYDGLQDAAEDYLTMGADAFWAQVARWAADAPSH